MTPSQKPRKKTEWPLGSTKFWGEVEPWDWLRHITPWWLLEWLFARYHLCWSGMVMWKMGYGWVWSISRDCLYPHDYCGWYDHVATQEERQEALRIIGEPPVLTFKKERGE